MNRSLSILFILLGMGLTLTAQYTVSGSVTIPPDNVPLAEYPVGVLTTEGEELASTFTAEDGFYNLSFDAVEDGPTTVVVTTFDICSGETLTANLFVTPSETDYVVDFSLCTNINPPDTTTICQAFFTSEPLNDVPLGFQFTNLSSSQDPIDEFIWDFGDGFTSNEENPVHVYAMGGLYSVSLAIFSGDCADEEQVFFTVFDPGLCDCPDVEEPVCVIDHLGQLVTYGNSCLATCAGYPEDFQFSCDEDCFCHTFYAPVCVINETGDTLTFQNHCFAECEGFGADQWIECEIDPIDPCACDDPFQPVCVLDENGDQLAFNNECEALCLGYTEDQFVLCDPCPFDLVIFGITEFCVFTDEGDTITYTDICEATFDGYDLDQFFLCGTFDCSTCSDVFEPVCVQLPDGNIFEYQNSCFAECAGYDPSTFVECLPDDPCDCGHDLFPVCVQTDEGEQILFENACIAECSGYTQDQFVLCDPCPFDEIFGFPTDSVFCGLNDAGDTITFANLCEAFFLGYSDQNIFFCGDSGTDCECFHFYDPVCVVDSISGEIIEFENDCFANCAGYEADEFTNCNPLDSCGCGDQPFQPICVLDDQGNQISFDNPCLARCAGHFDSEFVECDPCPFDDIFGLPENIVFCAVINPETDEIITFESICEASFAGFSIDLLFACDTTPTTSPDCQAEFTGGPISEDGLTFQFEGFSFSVNDSPVISWSWTFGDGATSSEQNPQHTYGAPGMYEVALTIVTLDGCTSTVGFGVIAGEDSGSGQTDVQCQSFFFVEQPDLDNLLLFQFVDFTIGEVESWSWDFGDGGTSNQQHPIYEYAEAGTYEVTLTATGNGCQSVVSITIEVGEGNYYGDFDCRAWFLPIITSDSTAFFLNLSSADAVSYAWSFGDGTGSSDYEVFHEFPGPGTYTVSLTIETGEGCQNTFEATITLGGEESGFIPEPSFRVLSSTSEIARAELLELTVAPNPTQADVQLRWQSLSAGSVDYQLVDAQGRMALTGRTNAVAGLNQLRLDLSDQPAGMYLIRLRTPEGLAVQRLIKN
ncbi:MAG: PKD domain-containing protein [Bacteroidota bacterium]